MKESELKLLISTDDRLIADDIQHLLEQVGIYSLLLSDNPASSILSLYTGLNPIENITIQVSKDDYQQACQLVLDSPYSSFLVK